MDIKPGSCPNPVNVKSRGVLPVAILGGANFDVRNIDPTTITLEGIQPLKWGLEDVATPFNPVIPKEDRLDCNEKSADGFPDLTLKFDTQQMVKELELTGAEDKSIQEWFLKFKLNDETELTGSDVVWILNNEPRGNPYQSRRTKQKNDNLLIQPGVINNFGLLYPIVGGQAEIALAIIGCVQGSTRLSHYSCLSLPGAFGPRSVVSTGTRSRTGG